MRPRSGRLQPAPKIIPAAVSWLMLSALAQFTGDVARTIAELVVDALSWLLAEFLAGCAAYAEAMHPMQLAAARPESPAAQAIATPSSTATRPRLIVASDSTRHTPGHANQLATTGCIAVRDRTAEETETRLFAAAPATRRKTRPR